MMTNSTVEYYNKNAEQYAQSTFTVSMTELYDRFESRLPPSPHILDGGCGSGRDALYFHQTCGYTVTAFDQSEQMVNVARELTNLPIEHRTFESIDEVSCYDGVWACASLLHTPPAEIPVILSKLSTALKHGGVLYTCFKIPPSPSTATTTNRQQQRVCSHSGRLFTDADEDIVREQCWFDRLLWREVEMWRTSTSTAPPSQEREWFPNILAVKSSVDFEEGVVYNGKHTLKH